MRFNYFTFIHTDFDLFIKEQQVCTAYEILNMLALPSPVYSHTYTTPAIPSLVFGIRLPKSCQVFCQSATWGSAWFLITSFAVVSSNFNMLAWEGCHCLVLAFWRILSPFDQPPFSPTAQEHKSFAVSSFYYSFPLSITVWKSCRLCKVSIFTN